MSEIQVVRNEARSRYEAVIDGEVVGVADYVRAQDEIVFTHTYVPPRFGGRGVASAIARVSLRDARATPGLRVVPQCSFYAEWIRAHPHDVQPADPGGEAVPS